MNSIDTGNNETDRELVNRVLHGDNAAFAGIIKNTEVLVAHIVFKMVDHAEDRKDLAQETYLKVYKSLPGFRFQSRLSTWIAQVAYNTCLDHLRKKKLVLIDTEKDEPEPANEDAGFSFHFPPGGETNKTVALLQQKQTAAIIQQEMDLLPPVYKTLLTLYHQQELSYDEITVITSLPPGTVKSYLFRARRLLKNNLLKKYKKEDI